MSIITPRLVSGVLAAPFLSFVAIQQPAANPAQNPGAPMRAVPPVSQQYFPDPASPELLKKLVRRITYAATPAEYALAEQLGYEGFIEYQLKPETIPDAAADAKIAQYAGISMTSQQLWAWSDVVAIIELQDSAIARATLSNKQLYERMVEFWNDHFNIYSGKSMVWNLLLPDRREVIRKNALTTFPELLKASTKSPAMLHYLDNQLSTAVFPNQNFARELMELHSLGIDNGYTQQDVVEVARCLTGWGYYNFGSQPQSGTFFFDATKHDNGAKTVLGHTIPAGGGVQDGLAVIDILAYHPNTAGFIAKKLSRWLLGENVSRDIINSVRDEYLATGGDIKSMIRVALRRKNVAASELKFKRPFHAFCGALRSMNAQLDGTYGSHRRARFAAAGHQPFDYLTPNGAPDTFVYWGGSHVPRWNFHGELLQGIIWDTSVNTSSIFTGATTAEQCVNKIDERFFLGTLSDFEKRKLIEFLAVNPGNTTRRNETIVLALSSPSYQWF
ncbi:MAG: DUF1800 domain-containing protein [Planctomycetota bacterium]